MFIDGRNRIERTPSAVSSVPICGRSLSHIDAGIQFRVIPLHSTTRCTRPSIGERRNGSVSDSIFRSWFLGPESVKLPLGLHWKLVGNIESEFLAVVPKPHDGSARTPELGEVGLERLRNTPVGDTDIETEPTAVVRPGRIEKLPDGHSEACGQTEKLVDRYVPPASLYCANRRTPPAVAEMSHAIGEVSLGHVPKDAIRPDVCGQSVGRAAFVTG